MSVSPDRHSSVSHESHCCARQPHSFVDQLPLYSCWLTISSDKSPVRNFKGHTMPSTLHYLSDNYRHALYVCTRFCQVTFSLWPPWTDKWNIFSVLYLPSAFPAYFLSPGTITSLVSIIGQSHVQNATHPSLTILCLTIDSSTRHCVLLLLNQLLLVPVMFI